MPRLLHSILGNSQKLDGGAMFGNAPKAIWETWAPADAHNRIDLSCRAMLIREPSRWVLLETGIGAYMDPHLRERFGVQQEEHVLMESLAEIGLTDADIDVVVLSHLHFDHAGGLLSPWEEDQTPRLMFPRARFVVGATAWERAKQPHWRDRASFVPELPGLLEQSGRLEIVEERSEILGDDYRFHISHGHTPGMLLTEIVGEEGPVVFAGDLVPGIPWVRRAITMGYDRFPERLIDEKTALLDELEARKGRLFFTHDPSCAMARVIRDDRGRITCGERWSTLSGVAT
ncbi:MAG: MBL fold metallo-hydrolase [Myxococcota bacterium]|jgi:glyoxylase-like metal-dependent hydrolase (beta-lactamase superfamily II)|nr:MBL fold metallo-hydrolase [Myxococcota bacterium]